MAAGRSPHLHTGMGMSGWRETQPEGCPVGTSERALLITTLLCLYQTKWASSTQQAKALSSPNRHDGAQPSSDVGSRDGSREGKMHGHFCSLVSQDKELWAAPGRWNNAILPPCRLSYRTGQDTANCDTCRNSACVIYRYVGCSLGPSCHE